MDVVCAGCGQRSGCAATVAFVVATWLYNGLAPQNQHWAGNLGYTDAEVKEQQKKKKESESEDEH